MKVDAKKLKDAGIDIIEEVRNISRESPIELDSLDGFEIDDVDYGNYLTNPDEEIFYDVSVTTFSIYELDELVIYNGDLEDLQNYLKSKMEALNEN